MYRQMRAQHDAWTVAYVVMETKRCQLFDVFNASNVVLEVLEETLRSDVLYIKVW